MWHLWSNGARLVFKGRVSIPTLPKEPVVAHPNVGAIPGITLQTGPRTQFADCLHRHLVGHFYKGTQMDKWILEEPGGVLPENSTDEAVQHRFTPEPDPTGQFPCNNAFGESAINHCSQRFKHMAHAIFHRRQVHKVYEEQNIVARNMVLFTSKKVLEN